MGEIVPRFQDSPRRVVLIGQAPGADGDARPLTGTMGLRLARLAGLPADEQAAGLWFDRANVLDVYPGRSDGEKGHAFPTAIARQAAATMWAAVREYDRVLFCGKAVKESFLSVACGPSREQKRMWRTMPMLSWCAFPHEQAQFAWMPHTSMIVPWWNDPANVESASVFLRDLLAWTRGRHLRAVA